MENTKFRRYDIVLALVFGVLTVLFLVLAFTNGSFFNWAYERHQNQISWYIRPLFLIPFCFFAYKRSWAGIFATFFFLLTSMFWFPKPETVNEQVQQFLAMEKDWLSGDWNAAKILMTLLIPASFIALGVAFWKRSLWFGISVVVFMAVAKMVWSVAFGGESGTSIFVPAIIGLLICVELIIIGFRKLEKKEKAKR